MDDDADHGHRLMKIEAHSTQFVSPVLYSVDLVNKMEVRNGSLPCMLPCEYCLFLMVSSDFDAVQLPLESAIAVDWNAHSLTPSIPLVSMRHNGQRQRQATKNVYNFVIYPRTTVLKDHQRSLGRHDDA